MCNLVTWLVREQDILDDLPCGGGCCYQQTAQLGSFLIAALRFSVLVMKWGGCALKGKSFGPVFP